MVVNGTAVAEGAYYDASGQYQQGDEITFLWSRTLETHQLNGKIAFTYGELVLAADSAKSNADIALPVKVSGEPVYKMLEPEEDELVRIECQTDDGILLLTDYQSCGKMWTEEPVIFAIRWLEGCIPTNLAGMQKIDMVFGGSPVLSIFSLRRHILYHSPEPLVECLRFFSMCLTSGHKPISHYAIHLQNLDLPICILDRWHSRL